MQRKKILFVINTMGRAGAENAMIAFMKQFDTAEYELHLLSLIGRGEVFRDVPKDVVVHNRKIDCRPVHGKGSRTLLVRQVLQCSLAGGSLLRNIPYLFRNIRSQLAAGRFRADRLFWKLISDGTKKITEEFDLAVAYLEGGAAYYVADHVRARKKCAFIHIDYIKAGYNPVVDSRCYTKIDRIFTVSRETERIFLSVYPEYREKTFFFHNIMDVEKVRRMSALAGGFNDSYAGTRLLTIGRLNHQKAYEEAVLILKRLKEKGYDVRWYVVGEGSLRGRIEKSIREQGLTEDFILLGARENPYPWLKQCDIYVHETKYEGKSIAVAEAQILGKPIVASRCTGNMEQIEDGVNGILTELTVESASEGIIKMIEDEPFRRYCMEEVKKTDFAYPEDMCLITELLE